MKIGFDAKRIYHNTTGLGNYGRDLVRILSDLKPSNSYFLYNPKAKKVDRLPKNKNIIEKLPNTKFWRFFSSIWRQKPIILQLEKDGVEIYHGLSGEIPVGIENSKIKTVVTIHDLIFMRYPNLYSFFDQRIHVKKAKNAVKNADKIIAISEQTKTDIVDFLNVDKAKIEVIYQGCHEVFKEEKSILFKKQVLDKYKLPTNFVLNVGTINARKNVLSLIKALKNIDISLVIVGGKTSYYQHVERYIKQHHLQTKIFIIESLSLSEISALYQQSKIFVYPSIFEGFGIPIIEALYSKTPVITSTGSCFAEAGGPNSIYVKPNDIETLTQKINLILKDEDVRNNMIKKGFEFVQQFNDANIAASFSKVYTDLKAAHK